MRAYLGDLLLHHLALGTRDFDVYIIVSVINGLSVSQAVLAGEEPTDGEEERCAGDVADADDEPGDMVSKVREGKLVSTTRN